MADDTGDITEQVFEPSPERAQNPFGEHYPWIFTFFGEDVLEVTSWNSAAGVRLRISGRVHTGPGVVVPFSATHTPNTDRTAVTSVITMPVGELLNAIVWAEAGAPQQGQTLVRVAVRRGAGAAFERLGVLIQGTVTANAARAFPGSSVQSPLEVEPYLRAIVGTTPAAGNALVETVPTGARWELLSWAMLLTTNAVVIDRKPYLQAVIGGVNGGVYTNFSTIPASSAANLTFAAGLSSTSDPIQQLYQAGWGIRLLLPAGGILVGGARALQGTDQFSACNYVVREWLDV